MFIPTPNKTKILAVDPGFERMGVAVLNEKEVIFSDCFKTPKELPFPERLFLIGQEIEKIIKKYKPLVLAIETLYFATNQKTALAVAKAIGVIVYEGKKYGLAIKEYTPLQVKIATTGYGKADKKQVTQMIRKLIKIRPEIKSDDELDAIAIGLTALNSKNLVIH